MPLATTMATPAGIPCQTPGSGVSGSETTTRESAPKWANRSFSVLDAVVVRKAADGTISEVEIEAEAPAFDRVDGEVLELLSHDDLLTIAGSFGDDTTTLVVVWENLWAAAFAEAVRDRGGIVVAHDRVPAADVAAAVAALDDAATETTHEGSPA